MGSSSSSKSSMKTRNVDSSLIDFGESKTKKVSSTGPKARSAEEEAGDAKQLNIPFFKQKKTFPKFKFQIFLSWYRFFILCFFFLFILIILTWMAIFIMLYSEIAKFLKFIHNLLNRKR